MDVFFRLLLYLHFAVVRVTLILQNILVILCAGIILALLYVKPGDVVTLIVCKIAIIALGSLANLAGKGTTIAVERDWVVVIVGGDKEILAGNYLSVNENIN